MKDEPWRHDPAAKIRHLEEKLAQKRERIRQLEQAAGLEYSLITDQTPEPRGPYLFVAVEGGYETFYQRGEGGRWHIGDGQYVFWSDIRRDATECSGRSWYWSFDSPVLLIEKRWPRDFDENADSQPKNTEGP
jgi:hypothetical protein